VAPPADQLNRGARSPGLRPLDDERLLQARTLAEASFGLTEPNPRVGCVIGFEDGQVLAQGATQQAGGPHAEAMALCDAVARGISTQGATAWVTLEPCAHHGRTPPCCDALIEAGIARVVIGSPDPFPQVNGAGIKRLRTAGVQVDLADGAEREACRELNIGFFSRLERGRPWVRLKVASSADGFSALPDGQSRWITGEAARRDGHAWRRRASAVLTGVGTVLADDPRLDVRLVDTPAQPWRVVLDSRWRTPPAARLLAPPGRALVVGVGPAREAGARLRATGAEVVELETPLDRVPLDLLLTMLAERGVNELHVEAGATLNGTLLAGGWVDECLLYVAPRLLGSGRPIADWPAPPGAAALADGPSWRFIDSMPLGGDLRLRLRPAA
jgi:diaminohydroxyphosphoribosylaminopyrimidine deaminase/5-amino-6-(5-phosphoribosylamino)uracil reductase